MKKFIFLITLFLVNIIYSQIQYDSIIKPRLNFSLNKSKVTDSIEKVILDNDTLYNNTTHSKKNLDFLLESSYADKGILYVYNFCAFNSSKKVSELKQWSVPIVVYFDKNIPKKIVSDFHHFYSQVKGVKNLEIGFTSDINKANYYIKSTSKIINGYSDEYKFKSNEEKENSILTGATYNINTDKNNKFYAGTLSINHNKIRTPSFNKQLKQLFFLSLFNSFLNNYVDKSSLLSKQYEDSTILSKYDLSLLKIHYSIIYDQKVNRNTFKILLQLANNQQ